MSARRHDGDRPLDQRKHRDRALILPLVGLFALLPPFAGVFELDLRVLGVPFTALYLFVVWGLLITGAALLAPRLRDDSAQLPAPEPPGDPGE